MTAAEYRFAWHGDVIRVLVAGDVLALPDERWSMGGFGNSITREWLLHEARLPGLGPKRKGILAGCLVRALEQHHGNVPVPVEATEPTGPFIRCEACAGSGFVPVTT